MSRGGEGGGGTLLTWTWDVSMGGGGGEGGGVGLLTWTWEGG